MPDGDRAGWRGAFGATQAAPSRVWATLVAAMAMLGLAEVALQARAQWLYGASIFSSAGGTGIYRTDPATGLKLLRPGAKMGGARQRFESNRLGLRSDEVAPARSPGSLRIAVLGASSVMGAYAASNEHTFPARMQQLLRARSGERSVEVVNAGVAGLSLRDQGVLLRQVLLPLKPDLIVLYPGFNDMTAYCHSVGAVAARRGWLADLTLPKWLLSVDLLLKNTAPLRDAPRTSVRKRTIESIDPGPFRVAARDLIEGAAAHGIRVAMMTNARSFRRDQPVDVQRKLAESTSHFSPCFDVDQLNDLHDLHNDILADEARRAGAPVYRLDQHIPGGAQYFVDGSHFSDRGERWVASHLIEFLQRERLLD